MFHFCDNGEYVYVVLMNSIQLRKTQGLFLYTGGFQTLQCIRIT